MDLTLMQSGWYICAAKGIEVEFEAGKQGKVAYSFSSVGMAGEGAGNLQILPRVFASHQAGPTVGFFIADPLISNRQNHGI